jgi:hypothetical protein
MGNGDFDAYLTGGSGQTFSGYAAGKRVYGGGRSNPTSGPVDKIGYRERDLATKSRKNAMLRRMKANKKGQYASSAALTPIDPTQRNESY